MKKQELFKKVKEIGIYGLNIFGTVVEGIPTETAIKLIKQLDEPQKPVVPQFVADWYEENKDEFEDNLYRCAYNIPSSFDGAKLNEFERWFLTAGTKPFQTLVNMHQFGYEVEKEKRYLVKLKGVVCNSMVLKHNINEDTWYMNNKTDYTDLKSYHTRTELEEAGFGWVFDCEGIEIEEVE